MGLFKKKSDPISERTKSLNAEIAALEARIKKLDAKVQQSASVPKLRSTALPRSQSPPPPPKPEPIFEPVDQSRFEPEAVPETNSTHYNDLGVRKYDIAAAWQRLRNHFRGPPPSNPKLVTYLVAGSIKGLRPLRYEKRVARNRFIALFLILVALLWGIVKVFVGSR